MQRLLIGLGMAALAYWAYGIATLKELAAGGLMALVVCIAYLHEISSQLHERNVERFIRGEDEDR